ncbi:MAG: hypothetical protein AB7H77_01965 [Bdellovibrionales bacterium]
MTLDDLRNGGVAKVATFAIGLTYACGAGAAPMSSADHFHGLPGGAMVMIAGTSAASVTTAGGIIHYVSNPSGEEEIKQVVEVKGHPDLES